MTGSPQDPLSRPTVAIFNASDDTVDMIGELLTASGMRCVNGRFADLRKGTLDFVGFIAQHQPNVIIFDINPPYDRNWNFFKILRETDSVKHRPIVLTTTNKASLDDAAGRDSGAREVIGKPYDMNQLLEAVRRALLQSSVR